MIEKKCCKCGKNFCPFDVVKDKHCLKCCTEIYKTKGDDYMRDRLYENWLIRKRPNVYKKEQNEYLNYFRTCNSFISNLENGSNSPSYHEIEKAEKMINKLKCLWDVFVYYFTRNEPGILESRIDDIRSRKVKGWYR